VVQRALLGGPSTSLLNGIGMLLRKSERELSSVYYTLYEAMCYIGLGRTAPLVATLLLVVLAGGSFFVILGVLSVAAGHPLQLNAFRSPRSLAGLAVLGGYFLWNRFASPEATSFVRTDYSDEPGVDRDSRRLRVGFYVLIVAASVWFFAHWVSG